MMFTPLPVDRMGEGLFAAYGYGIPLSIIIPPGCGVDTPISVGDVLIGGTVFTPLGAKAAIVGVATVPVTAGTLAGGARTAIGGTRTRPAGSAGGGGGSDTTSTGSDDVLGDDIDCP